MSVKLTLSVEAFALRHAFKISRGTRTEAVVVTVHLSDGENSGWAECTPYPRYGESVGSVIQTLEDQRNILKEGLTRATLQSLMKPGAARNALDCALWDLEAKRSKKSVPQIAGNFNWKPVTTAYTISLGTVEEMAETTAKEAHRPVLKIKFGSPEGDLERIKAIRLAAPQTVLIADANEGWTGENLQKHLNCCADYNYALVEQPVPAAQDEALRTISRPPLILCADESVHDRATLDRLVGLYDAINIKLDKTGGLTEALMLAHAAKERNLDIMVGSMLCTSLGIAPAMVLAPMAQFVDLDSPLLVREDRPVPIKIEDGLLFPPSPDLWG